MHGLAEFEHDVLGDVDEKADRAHAAATQALGHPQRRRHRRVDAVDHAAGETRHLRAGIEFDLQHGVARRRHGIGLQRFDLAAERGGGVEGDAAHAEAVGAVRRELEFDRGVGQAEVISERRADRRVGGQFEQAGGIGVDAEFLRRAEHAVGVDAAQLRGLDRQFADLGADGRERRDQARTRVRRAADDLQVRAGAGIDPADLQAVGFGMLRALDDARDDHAVERGAEHRQLLDFQADGGQRRRELLARGVGLHVLPQPVFGEFHAWTPCCVIPNAVKHLRFECPDWKAGPSLRSG